MLVGTVVHDLLQTTIKRGGKVSHNSVKDEMNSLLQKSRYLTSIWANQESLTSLKSEIEKYIPQVVNFASGLRINDRNLLVRIFYIFNIIYQKLIALVFKFFKFSFLLEY